MVMARTLAVALSGVTGQVVEVEADLSAGLPGLTFTGLADVSVVEARDRIRAAVLNSDRQWPNRRITIALLPADVRKVGSRFDLALAVAVLAAARVVPAHAIARRAWIAELGLDGRLRPVRGVLPAVLAAHRAGVGQVIVAEPNAAEAALVSGIEVRAASTVGEVIAWLCGEAGPPPVAEPAAEAETARGPDLAEIAGQTLGKRALEVSAAGAHHLYLLGPPGAGKTMLAQRLPGLLPTLDDAAALDVTAVHSVAGRLSQRGQLLRRPPFQAPHHTASVAALVGGGSGLATPGAISLAHHGVLFLDEAPEFNPSALDGLRQPLEEGRVLLHRSHGSVSYPARFMLVLAANPCPCGARSGECTCAPGQRRRYRMRLSGPLLDRVDIRLVVDPVSRSDLLAEPADRESSAVVAHRVEVARAAAAERWQAEGWPTNGEVPGGVLRRRPWRLPRAALQEAESHLDSGELSARGFDRVLRVAWTIADLSGHMVPDGDDVREAVFLRTGRDTAWAA
ncbi:MAG TPA: YifB family Mg chelatase-like AAA ATPase [Jatrophihabitantaceae bacterium]|jgi:magnesium chelatase family protein